MDTATDRRRVTLYGRVSIEREERSKSVDDQLAELRAWADRERWTIVSTHRDDGVSASRYANGRTRPGWQQAMDDVTTGEVDALLVWEISRASRDRPVFAALFAACADAQVLIGTGGRLHDLTDADDGFVLDLGAALAVRESAVISKRTRRAVESRAAAGRPAGSVPFGYRRVIDPHTGRTIGRDMHREQAPIVAEIVRRLLERQSAMSIAADLNRRGIPTANGKRWRSGNMTLLALRPTYAGLRVHRGQVLDGVRGTWPPIISVGDHHRLVEMHTDPARDKFRNPTHAKHLGTGIFRCGREGCTGRMRVMSPGFDPKGRPRPASYCCRTCFKVSRLQGPVDELIEELLCRRFAEDPDVLERLGGVDQDDSARDAAAEVARLKIKLRQARQAWDDDRMSLEAYADMEARTLPKIRSAEQRARPRRLPGALYDVVGPHAEQRWKALPIGGRRAIVAAVLDVEIMPAGRGQWRFDPRQVKAAWRAP